MPRKKEDPVNYGDFAEFKASVESRLASLETEQKWVKETLDQLSSRIEGVKKAVDRYKWWILGGFFGSTTLFTLFTWLLKAVMG